MSVDYAKQAYIPVIDCSEAHIFNNVNYTRDWITGTRVLFKNLPGFRKKFYYSITVEREQYDGPVVVKTSIVPGEKVESTFNLEKSINNYPKFDKDVYFPLVSAKLISTARRNSLINSIWAHIKTRFPEREGSVNKWGSNYLGEIDARASIIEGEDTERFPLTSLRVTANRSSRSSVSCRSGAHAINSALQNTDTEGELNVQPAAKRPRN